MEYSHNATCPKCGGEVPVSIISSLKAGDAAVASLFDGSLNKAVCPSCGESFVIDSPLSYRDDETGFIVFLMEEPEEGSTETLENDVDAMATDIFMKENIKRPVVRLTFSRPDFIEKIAVRQRGFDDRLLEFAKLQLFRTMDELQLSRARHRLLFDYSSSNDEVLQFIVYDREGLKPINAIQVPMSEFRSLEKSLMESEDLQMELDAAFPGCYVSADRLL